ncbi:hypothetical protein ACHHYP_09048 [Achlya hypogyna]|uniref:THO complex subunit 5 n=1 Tax=Achlya hypogyna TaxID=1202772 RepID=A0A1V9ZJH9_ACHHY|nr:hypothetical protein ACHHYP_09048 [Achlya hypogyna]
MDRNAGHRTSTAVGQLTTACQELRGILPKLLHAKDSEVSPQVARALLLLQKIKGSTRDTFLEAESWRKRVAEQKDLVESHHLKLQNLLYEKDHLLREIKRCRGFAMKEMEKIAFPEGQLPVSEDPDMHAEHLLRLETEKEAREEVQAQQRELHAKIAAVEEATVEKRAFLESLPAEIAAIEKASQPLQKLLAIPVTSMDHARQQEAKSLPSPLYTLYTELDAYMHALGGAAIELRVTEAPTTLPRQLKVSSRPPRGAGPVSAAKTENRTRHDGDERAAKRQKTAVAVSRSPSPSIAEQPAAVPLATAVQSAEAFQMAPRALELKLLPPAGSTEKAARVIFYFLPVLNVVTVETPDFPQLLALLFAKDTGDVTPNLAAGYALETEEGLEVEMDFPADTCARPYLWAQWVCGLAVHKRHDPARPEPSIRYLMAQLRARYEAKIALLTMTRRLDDRRVTPHPSVAVPRPRKAALAKWGKPFVPQGTDVFAVVNPLHTYHRAVIESGHHRIVVFVELAPGYPSVAPRLVCQADRAARDGLSAAQLKDMALEASTLRPEWLTKEAKPWLLMHQMATLLACLDEAVAQGDKYAFGSKRAEEAKADA